MQNDMRDRLVELLNFVQCKAECCSALDGGRCGDLDNLDRCQIEAIADHLIANGVVLPPCKVGDTVYSFAYPRTDIIVIDKETVEDLHFIVETDECYYDERDIGRTVFLTKDQAEQKLKEMRVENGNL